MHWHQTDVFTCGCSFPAIKACKEDESDEKDLSEEECDEGGSDTDVDKDSDINSQECGDRRYTELILPATEATFSQEDLKQLVCYTKTVLSIKPGV
ncbi:hypothetical protein FIE12Z_5509 [Fusarium flagelliforme]|uniref:Uncharacterized protein n=1 Tax=Fusarium flagelliforme TaxID=2675880 RepID=A0A395MT29_9HYPO|nr:hypothetical protein FIE12Z_5509 [Fusarium flagelliforme]